MSTSQARRWRLRAARTLPQAHCLYCGTDLSRVTFPTIHLERCAKVAEHEKMRVWLAAQIANARRPSRWQRLLAWLRRRGRVAPSGG